MRDRFEKPQLRHLGASRRDAFRRSLSSTHPGNSTVARAYAIPVNSNMFSRYLRWRCLRSREERSPDYTLAVRAWRLKNAFWYKAVSFAAGFLFIH
jgi:hypothetical protein